MADLLAIPEYHAILTNLAFPALVAIACQILYFKAAIDVARARFKYRVFPPATTGNPDFERVFRVQQNFVEMQVPFLMSLFLCAIFVNGKLAAACGTVWLIFRYMYGVYYKNNKVIKKVYMYTAPMYLSVLVMVSSTVVRIMLFLLR
eukprot:TRINITY_DN21643_c0_g1_i1.p1 TRINITY_DN21643_c0_g1~~TRINITY_DN21643_c0_g1_i1.p1  ORF type:complete len:147 (+),score=29.16 TRINITY_DN21643_c0_g1_i1:57-497(+)